MTISYFWMEEILNLHENYDILLWYSSLPQHLSNNNIKEAYVFKE